jgi:multicomponent Na+:H+ antiporter subunit G
MNDFLIVVFSTLGTLFAALAGVGLLRMPDTFLRISVTTKAATLGVGLLIGCAAIYFQELAVTSEVLAIILFIFLTAPIGGHLLGRTAYYINCKLSKQTHIDDLKGKYNKKTHELSSEDSDAESKDESIVPKSE